MLYMELFNGKVMMDFDVDDMPSFRMLVVAKLIDSKENQGNLVKIMEEELVAD